MEILHNYLPKDLVNIVEEYSKDTTNYDKVLFELADFHILLFYSEKAKSHYSLSQLLWSFLLNRHKSYPDWMVNLSNRELRTQIKL